ncbi:cyclic di-GMP phosphodiesterase response regulator RpfG [Andreesenia angusta]|uniref:Cyclic di-GMP phosphodiesterase response regulator RpfG n=1 Tax=Andreesenia angusta TaxID=39480 RepID=A0A1S1VA19_9FIRM|nr:HD-GYP domain-containing protein [Andreesenia angusta]OHW63461.1 cyclic di-GMP phosphodiesterase response regulator RpfG [Andreesenia angusta]
MKIRKHLKDCKNGDVIAEDIYIPGRNIPIAVEGNVIDNKLMDRLIEGRVFRVLVEDFSLNVVPEKTRKLMVQYTHDLKRYKQLFQDIASGKKVDLEEIADMSKGLLENSEDIFRVVESIKSLRGSDEYTYTHSINVALYSMMIAKWMGLDERSIEDVMKAGLLHDIGKAKVPKWILDKKGPLTEAEFDKIKEHPLIGYELCGGIDSIRSDVKEAVLLHHEKMDGTGYPQELGAADIGLYAKIVAVADVYDAMTSERPYKARKTPFEVFKELKESEYGKLDIEVKNVFLQNIAFFYVGAKVKLNTGEVGEVAFVYPHKLDKPIVKLENGLVDISKTESYEIKELI